jgi:DNA-binding response OmpR family regulator
MKALVIGGNNKIIKQVAICLEFRYEDIEVFITDQGLEGIELAMREMPEIAIIDLPLPDISDLHVVTGMREVHDLGIIFLSEKQSEFDRAELLEAGADDYVLKPLEHMEFLAKINALLRRIRTRGFNQQRMLTLRTGLSIDSETREIHSNGKTSRLTPTEYNLLMELLKKNGDVLTNETILEKVWGADCSVNYDSIKRYVHRLRLKIEIDSKNPKMILNKRGIGYKIIRSN